LSIRIQKSSNHNSTCYLAFKFECHVFSVCITFLFYSNMHSSLFEIDWIQMKRCTCTQLQNTCFLYLITLTIYCVYTLYYLWTIISKNIQREWRPCLQYFHEVLLLNTLPMLTWVQQISSCRSTTCKSGKEVCCFS
jgi:hypothetical protein